MNHKDRCWDLEHACAKRDTPILTAISAEQDKYLKHHRGFGGTAWVHLKSPGGGLDTEAEALPPEYRSHGGSSDAEVPLIIFNAQDVPDASYFKANVDLTRWLSFKA
jgi:phosphonoacetate hydrolase